MRMVKMQQRELTLDEVVKRFLMVKEAQHTSEGTMQNYRNRLRQFVESSHHRVEYEQLEADVLSFFSAIPDTSPARYNNPFQNVNALLNWMVEQGYIPQNPIKVLKLRKRKDEGNVKPIPIDDLKAFLYSLNRATYIKLYEDDLPYHFRKAGFGAGWNSARHRSLVQRLYDSIDANQDTGENLLLIKDWLCAVLHTAGSPAFHNLSPWVSASAGSKRYKTAYLFGAGRADSYRGERTRRRFVIFDTWVSPGDEHRTFERTQFLIARFREIGLPWYADRHYEIMLKYAIYPQNLIGYYYFENDMPLHYYLNPHYWSRMESDPHFQIGDEVMIDQTDVGFPADNPYRIIYERRGGRFGVYESR